MNATSTTTEQAAPAKAAKATKSAKAVKTVKAAKTGRRARKETNGATAPEVQPAESKLAESKPAKRRTTKPDGAAQALSESAPVLSSPAEKPKRAKKEKVVRDSFTMPKSDYERIAKLKQKCLDAGVAVKKGELLRAGLQALDAIPIKRLLAAVSSVETVKTGRPAKS
ncbi:hypothetical protein Busp01_41820 [Trinickia caryophylli]|nr:hypothetical protein [Trinickia caryophylli]PMS08921.1 hypothetical protein C0Z17_27735 [Trinickia caryophylli]TRX18984.1 hypothetical protein FNF07_12585 [Trinickia caryophylli]GLU34340.1 hypothetical protein Busp01_41820 [Trinickia caryophylli]